MPTYVIAFEILPTPWNDFLSSQSSSAARNSCSFEEPSGANARRSARAGSSFAMARRAGAMAARSPPNFGTISSTSSCRKASRAPIAKTIAPRSNSFWSLVGWPTDRSTSKIRRKARDLARFFSKTLYDSHFCLGTGESFDVAYAYPSQLAAISGDGFSAGKYLRRVSSIGSSSMAV